MQLIQLTLSSKSQNYKTSTFNMQSTMDMLFSLILMLQFARKYTVITLEYLDGCRVKILVFIMESSPMLPWCFLRSKVEVLWFSVLLCLDTHIQTA
jgi:hypothetical protein